jgi:putative ABC transport system substrate-binding protein
MRRREFITLLGGAATTCPLGAYAQQPAKMKRIAFVRPAGKLADVVAGNKSFRPWFEELGRLGYVEGQNLVVDRYSAEGRTDHFTELARHVVSTNPDVIFVLSNILVLAFKKSTATIPIVAIVGDPVTSGIVSSIARPSGNITGVATDAGREIMGKRLGLLLEAIPKASKLKYLISREAWEAYEGRLIQEEARHLGVTVTGALLEGKIDDAQYRSVFAALEQDRVDALIVSPEAVNGVYIQLIVDLAAKSRIPAMYPFREYVGLGGLMAYSPDLSGTIRRAANVVGQILNGANPGDIPFYQATKFELVINVKTAKALGLEMPPSLLLRADEVIE